MSSDTKFFAIVSANFTAYLKKRFTELPKAGTVKDIETLPARANNEQRTAV